MALQCPCQTLEERIAIMIYDGKITENKAVALAKEIVCKGCEQYRKQLDLL